MNELITYVDYLQKKNADDLAFYPVSAIDKAISNGHVITCKDNGEFAGYLWHGPIHPSKSIYIYQACVDYDSRKRHLGWGMVGELIYMGKSSYSLDIKLRCSSSSESNAFWQALGFYCTNTTKGGGRRNRDINHWVTDLQSPLMIVDEVIPSTKKKDTSQYESMRRKGVSMPNRWSRTHY